MNTSAQISTYNKHFRVHVLISVHTYTKHSLIHVLRYVPALKIVGHMGSYQYIHALNMAMAGYMYSDQYILHTLKLVGYIYSDHYMH